MGLQLWSRVTQITCVCQEKTHPPVETVKRDDRPPESVWGDLWERLPGDTLLRALQMTTLSREEWWGLLSREPPRREIQRESLWNAVRPFWTLAVPRWRTLCYTSDAALSLGAPRAPEDAFDEPGCASSGADLPLERGHAASPTEPRPSVEVSRSAFRGGGRQPTRQTFVPDRFLRGLLPDALLEAFAFWRNADDASLSGYEKHVGADATRVLAVSLSGPVRTCFS